MKAGTAGLLKFQLLKRDLGLSAWEATGLLQSLWDFTAKNTPRGDVGRFTDEEIALGLEYERDVMAMIDALVSRKWLERHPKYRLVVHDWHEHCEDSTHLKLARSGLLFWNAEQPKVSRLQEVERKKVITLINAALESVETKEDIEHAHGMRTACAQEAHGMRTSLPCPSLPLPSHTTINRSVSSDTESKSKRVNYSSEFEGFWERYPKHRRGHKGSAWREWKSAIKRASVGDIHFGLGEYLASADWTKDDGQWVCAIVKWLKDSMWEDHPVSANSIKPVHRPPPKTGYDLIREADERENAKFQAELAAAKARGEMVHVDIVALAKGIGG